MDPETTVTVISGQPESEQPNEQSEITELNEEVATVADEILVEVKVCREKQEQLMVDLALLRESDAEHKAQREVLLREIQNLREESRNLQAELKALIESSRSRPSELSIPSISQVTVEEPEIINPEKEEGREEAPIKKKRRYRI